MNLHITLVRNKLNFFLLLAFLPLFPIVYFGFVKRGDVLGWIIPFYGFLILFLKKDKLAAYLEAHQLYRVLGLVLMVASVFVYFAVAPFYPLVQFYGAANYTIYILGLFLVFFKVSALKESFATVFLIVAATASPFVGKWLETLMQPTVPYFVQIMDVPVKLFGIPATMIPPNAFSVQALGATRPVVLGVATGCIGIYSFLTFSVIIIVTMMEDSGRLRTKFLWGLVGILGTFLVNIIRVSLIIIVVYYAGSWDESAQTLHNYIGYALFLAWLGLFFLIYSKRQAIYGRFQSIGGSLRPEDKGKSQQPEVSRTENR